MAGAAAGPAERQGYQDGSRWIHEPPAGPDVAAWFTSNVKLHEGMEHDRYVQGLTLIPQVESVQGIRDVDGQPKKVDIDKRMVFTPYAKVETRIAYFWDLCDRRGWMGEIEPGEVARISNHESLRNDHLPRGFFLFPVQKSPGQWVTYLGCSMQVRAYERDVRSEKGRLVFQSPAGTKIVSILARYGEDPNVMMKAETGAVGRALGMAGMLVIPGSGVATAEDMQEALSQPETPPPAPPAALPAESAAAPSTAPQEQEGAPKQTPQQQTHAEKAGELVAQLQADYPDKHAEIKEWAATRNMNLGDLGSYDATRLRGVVKKLEKAVAEASRPDTSDPQDA